MDRHIYVRNTHLLSDDIVPIIWTHLSYENCEGVLSNNTLFHVSNIFDKRKRKHEEDNDSNGGCNGDVGSCGIEYINGSEDDEANKKNKTNPYFKILPFL